MIDYKIISSGSNGNAVRIENIMFDCGVPFKAMKSELYKCKYLFITHRHSDHVNKSTLKKIRSLFPNIKVVANYDVAFSHQVDVIANNGHEFTLDGQVFYPFDCPHDVGVPCTGYVFEINGQRVIYATDTYTLKHAPKGPYDYLFLESNYDEKKVAQIKNPRKDFGYNVVENSMRHLSTKKCKEFYYLHRRSVDSELIELHKSKRFY